MDLTREIEMLRIAMLRVLREEEHPSRMAHALAKLSFTLGRSLKQEVELKGKRELSENERWMIVVDHILLPFPALDASADEVATRERRELVMNEIWQVINAYE